MKKHFDEIIHWTGFAGGDTIVQIQIFDDVRNPGGHVVIMSEPPENKGTSITNGIKLVAGRVMNDHDLDPDAVTFIEHYPDRLGPDGDESFDVVNMQRRDVGNYPGVKYFDYHGPTWRRISFDDVKAWIGSDADKWSEL